MNVINTTKYANRFHSFPRMRNTCVANLRESAKQAADFGVTLGVQNHHDTAAHYESLADLLEEIAEPNCKAMFDAWAPALHGMDLEAAVLKMAPSEGARCCFQASDSGTFLRIYSASNAGMAPAQNMARQPHIGSRNRAATAASKYPIE